MHKSRIFLIGDDREHLIALEETGYMEEKVLQDYLVDYPDLLPGDQIDPENPRRWLLVAQEMAVPDEESGGGRWSLDHLFLDQEGIPTFVECKRATDTRARREVVAQMLDYAANGTEYWTLDRLRQAAAEAAQKRGRSLDDEIAALLGDEDADIEGYWDTVEANLRTHRIRLVFVADSTPKELRRLVEFLNQEMAHVDVLAVEVKQFRRADGKGQTALVPRVVGLTEAARKKGSRPQKKNLTREDFLASCTPVAREFFRRVWDEARARGHKVEWGKITCSLRARLPETEQLITFAYGYPDGNDPAHFDVYLKPEMFPPEEKETQDFRQALLDSGLFELTPSGNRTFTARITEESLPQLNEMYDFVLDTVDKILDRQGTEGTT